MRVTLCSIIILLGSLPTHARAAEATGAEVEQLRKEIAALKDANKKANERITEMSRWVDFGNLLVSPKDSKSRRFLPNEVFREKLNRGTVKTIKEAEKLAMTNQFRTAGGLGAMQSVGVRRLFQLGTTMPGFAKVGDLIWVVHVQRMGMHPRGGLNQIHWINNANGRIRTLMPNEREGFRPVISPGRIETARKGAIDEGTNWLFHVGKSEKSLPSEIATKLASLKQSTIATVDDARSIMGTFYFEATGELTIKDKVEVTDLFTLGVDVAGFGKKGDFVWQARIAKKGVGVVIAGWISSTTGELRLIGLEKADPKRLDRLSPHLDERRILK